MKGIGQNSADVKIIDSIVNAINSGTFIVKVDSSVIPNSTNPIAKTYLTTYSADSTILNKVQWTSEFFIKGKKGKVEKPISTAFLYYNANLLIKVEGGAVSGNSASVMTSYYYKSNEIILINDTSKNASTQAEYYLTEAKDFLAGFLHKN